MIIENEIHMIKENFEKFEYFKIAEKKYCIQVNDVNELTVTDNKIQKAALRIIDKNKLFLSYGNDDIKKIINNTKVNMSFGMNYIDDFIKNKSMPMKVEFKDISLNEKMESELKHLLLRLKNIKINLNGKYMLRLNLQTKVFIIIIMLNVVSLNKIYIII